VAQSSVGSWDTPNTHFLNGHDLREVSAIPYRDGRLAVVALGADGKVYWISQNAPNSGWGAWSGLEGDQIQGVTAVTNADGRLEVIALGGDGAFYHRYESTEGGWSTWEALVDGPYAKPVTAATNADGRLELFARASSSRRVVHMWQMAPNAKWTTTTSYLSSVIGTGPDDQAAALVGGRLALVTLDARSCLIAVSAQAVPNADFEGWPGVPSPCPPPPPPPPKVSLNVTPDYIAVGRSTNLNWAVTNCQAQCNVTLEGRKGLNYSELFLHQSGVSAQGSQAITPGDTFTRFIISAQSPGGSDSASAVVQLYRDPGSPQCAGCSWYYFTMNPPSSLVPCSNVAYFEANETVAEQRAESEWIGYTAESITYSEFVAGCH
jgi:hypothetical protein